MNDPARTGAYQPGVHDEPAVAAAAAVPPQIGRYRIERVLGKGGFGLVYRAHDDQLQRLVAIKVPHSHLVSRLADAEAYLTEARTVANLDHPHIVPVFDVGNTSEFPCYVVSKFIDGSTLARRIECDRPTFNATAELLATIAEALHYAHKQGLVHRDIKPGNILVDRSGKPFVADFGLALRERDLGKGPRYAGTPAYMSPEQARGEGHRVDGRSDIFSLGVVFYELLTERRPFAADTREELQEQITNVEARPLRQWDDTIPKELERICLKSLSKRATERYTTAKDMAEDLRHFLAEAYAQEKSTGTGRHKHEAAAATPLPTPSDQQAVRIVPKGLRSFDAHDADFFLELLPGPRDRDGLPDSIRFWKTHLEETDADNTFSVGLIYGPSGCGKSSLVKAGLLPRLSADVIAVYVEATAEETETRLLNGLRKRCLALPDNLSLKGTLAALRRGQGIPVGKKVVIVLDQFEQWLHARKEEQNTELVQALRQCDGARVQCTVMVRDDFWMAATRFMRDLEVRLVEAQNSAPVDLFDTDHATKVLTAFGRAFGKLPENSSATNKEQKEFLKQAVSGLTQEGKIVSVRLALFADMVKGKTWAPATLREVGGTEGVGVTFLEETFSAATAPPEHRYHQNAARGVLKALLPEAGTDIKGHMHSQAALLQASGYASRPRDFEDLLRILDREIRLITPTDPEGKESGEPSGVSPRSSGEKYYQLTHDYLVPSLRDWLTRKQRETRRGRAELRLAERAAAWNSKPEDRQLPSLLQWSQIRWWTPKKSWTPPQKKMMAKAGRHHAARGLVAGVLLAVATFTGLAIRDRVEDERNASHAAALVDSLLKAEIAQVPAIISDLNAYREWGDPLLGTKIAGATDGSAAKLVLALALLPVADSQIDYLREQLSVCTLEQFPVVRKALLPYKAKLMDALWRVVQDESQVAPRRFQAAAALAEYAPDDERWQELAPFVAQHLTGAVPWVYLGQWRQLFQPATRALTGPLTAIHADRGRAEKQPEAAAFVLSDYLCDQPPKLIDAILVADELAGFSSLLEALKPHAAMIKQPLLNEMHAAMPDHLAKTNDRLSEGDQQRRDAHWKRQSLAAVTLVHLGHGDEAWPLLKFSPDPSLRSFFIHHLGKLGTDYHTRAARLEMETDVSIRRALIQSLGGLDPARIPPAERRRIAERLRSLYVRDPDPGIHGSASWALRKWQVALPELPVGEPVLTEEQKARNARLTSEVEKLRQCLVASEQELPARQAAWERQLRERPAALPPSLSEGLVAHFPLDETAGKETANAVKDQPAGLYRGPSEPKRVPGVLGGALQLDGSSTVIGGKPVDLEGDQSFSYGCWFQYSSTIPMVLLSSREQTKGFRGFDLSLENDHQLRMQIAGEDPNLPDAERKAFSPFLLTVITKTTFAPGRNPGWHHVMVTYDGSKKAKGVTIFVDGLPQPTDILDDRFDGTIKSDSGFHIGSRQWASYRFRGAIDDVRIYNHRLLHEDVQKLYESGLQALAGVPAETRTLEQQASLALAYRSQDEPVQHLESQLTAARTAARDACWDGVRRWYVNAQGQTMVVIPNPAADKIGQVASRLAISSHEVTVAEFRRFRGKHVVERTVAPTADCPVHNASWYDAAEYCNWLSKQEGIPEDQWAYLPNDRGQYADGMTIKENSLELLGYRLPTEAEWESACRSGTSGTYSFGEPISLVKHYGWYGSNSLGRSYSVESLLPNEAGLFDLHGNVWEWTQNSDSGSSLLVKDNIRRVLRSASFNNRPSLLRSAQRDVVAPATRDFGLGFRPARTLSLGSLTAHPGGVQIQK